MKAKVKRNGTVELGGHVIGRVEKRQERTTHMGGSGGYTYAVGFSYETRWDAYDADGNRISGLSGWSRRCDAVEDLVDCWEGPTTGNETADALVSQRPRRY